MRLDELRQLAGQRQDRNNAQPRGRAHCIGRVQIERIARCDDERSGRLVAIQRKERMPVWKKYTKYPKVLALPKVDQSPVYSNCKMGKKSLQ